MTDPITVSTLLGGRIRLLQPRQGYRTAIDPVLLAAATLAQNGDRVLDVGTGTGAAALCLAARIPGTNIIGLEIQPILARLARDNAALNGMAERFQIVEGDIANPLPTLIPNLTLGSFDVVMTNPPYGAAGTPPPDNQRATAHAGGDLKAWLTFCLSMLRPKGWLVLIHRADHLDIILARLQSFLGAIEVVPLWPRSGVAARRVIVRGRKGMKSPLILRPGLVLHAGGEYTEQANNILRGQSYPGDPFAPPTARNSINQ